MSLSMLSWFNSGVNILSITVLCALSDIFQPCVADLYIRYGKGRRLSSSDIILSTNAEWANHFFGQFLPEQYVSPAVRFWSKSNRWAVKHLTYSAWQMALLAKIALHCLYSFYYICWRMSYFDGKDAAPLRREVIGTIILGAGSLLRLWAKHARGKFFDFIVTVREGHTFTVRGPYKYLLHPDCTGTLLELLGFVIFTRSWFISLYTVMSCYVLFLRIRDEERVLEREFGDEYAKRRKSISSVVPRIL